MLAVIEGHAGRSRLDDVFSRNHDEIGDVVSRIGILRLNMDASWIDQ